MGTYVCLVLSLGVRLIGLGNVGLGHVGHVGLRLGLRLVVGALVVVLVRFGLVVRLAGGLVFLLLMIVLLLVVPGRAGECCNEGGIS